MRSFFKLIIGILFSMTLQANADNELIVGDYIVATSDDLCQLASRQDFDSLAPAEMTRAKKKWIEIGYPYIPSINIFQDKRDQTAIVVFASTEFNAIKGNYPIRLRFDNQINESINAFSDGTKYLVGIKFKPFLRSMLPLFKKHNEVSVKIKGIDDFVISLKGFTRGFEMFEECRGGAVNLQKVDPFD